MRRTPLLMAATLAMATVLAACNDGEPSNREQPEPTFVIPSGKPTPSIPPTKPTTLQQTDLIVGTGATALPGKTLTVRYVGVHYDGKEFDSNFEQGKSNLVFVLGNERVIAGWDQGLIGMREGGRRQLVVPPELGYGPQGGGEGHPIGPNETLVFVVDLIDVA